MFNNPYGDNRERKHLTHEQALTYQRHLDLIEQERRQREQALEHSRRLKMYEAQRRVKRRWVLILLAAGGLVGGLMGAYFLGHHHSGTSFATSKNLSSGTEASSGHGGTKQAEPLL